MCKKLISKALPTSIEKLMAAFILVGSAIFAKSCHSMTTLIEQNGLKAILKEIWEGKQ